MKKILVMFSIGCFLLAGCGNNGREDRKKSGPPEIVMWLIGSEGQAITIRKLGEEFCKETSIKVKCDALSWGDAHSKYLTSIAGGVAPDIGTMGLTWGAEFGKLEAMVDLKKEYSKEVNSIKENVFSGLWNSLENKGSVYGIPFDMTEHIMYYRNDIIKNPPQTWDELIELLISLKKDGRGMIVDWGSLNWIGYSPFLWQAGGSYYNENFTASTIDSDEAVRAMNFFADLYTKYNVPKTKIPLEQGMRTGDFPIAISGNWMIDWLRLSAPEISGKWSIAMLPKGPTGKRTAFIGGRIIGIFSQSRNKDAAWQFIKFLSRPDIQAKLYEAALTKEDTYLPPNIKTWNVLKMDAAFRDVLFAQAKDAKGPPPIASWDSSAKYVDDAIQKVILARGDPKKNLGMAKAQLDRLLKK